MEETTAGDWKLYLKAIIKVNNIVWTPGHGVFMGSKLVGVVYIPVKSDRHRPRVLILVPNVHHVALPHDVNPYGYQVKKNGEIPWWSEVGGGGVGGGGGVRGRSRNSSLRKE
jgi:hypothetical protein